MADKKAAKKLAAEMLKMKIRKDFLSREEALDRRTMKTVKEKWLEILLNAKLPEMKENLRNILDYMEKLVELEVFRKRLFEEERIELNDQLNFQARSHTRAVDKLYDVYLQRIRDLHEIYNRQVSQKKSDAEEEFKGMNEKQERTEEHLKAILYQMQINQERQEDAMKCDMFLKTDDEKSKNAEKSENLRVKLERLMEKRWYQISSVLVDYQQSTEHRRNHYSQLKARDKQDSKLIHSQMKKTQKLYDQIQQLKDYLENPDAQPESTGMIRDCREERNKFYNSFVYLKKLMAEEMRMDDANLRELTALSKNSIDYLNVFLKRGEKIITLYSLCLKLETEKEKIVPVGGTLYYTHIPDHILRLMKSSLIHNITGGSDDDAVLSPRLQTFQKFWEKVGKVQLSVVALSQCIHDLNEENAVLKKIVHSYLNQLSKN